MTERVLDISATAAFLHSRNGLLVIEAEGQELDSIPFADLAAVVVSQRHVTFSQSVVTGLAQAGAALITCDERHHPAAMLLPLVGHHAQAERFRKQADLAQPRKKRWWQAVVRAKISAQARTLTRAQGTDYGVGAMAKRVGSGDPQNVEAQAARRYWTALFGNTGFQRGNEDDVRNAHLNYGYAILRASVVRALCASGLQPAFGLHHRNAQNPFALGDDLMESYRPVVDWAVVELSRSEQGKDGLTPLVKKRLIEAVSSRYEMAGEQRTLFDIVTRSAQGLASAILNGESEWRPKDWAFLE